MQDSYDEEWGATTLTPPPPSGAPTPLGDGLTPRQRELRDGPTIVASDEVRDRRATQIREVQAEHAEVLALIADLDRMRAHIASAECAPETIRLVDRMLLSKISQAQGRERGLGNSLVILMERQS